MLLSSARAAARALRADGTAFGVMRARCYLAPAVMSSLGEYNAHHGHVRVPTSFVVPDEEGWAVEARGLKLGREVDALRRKKKKGALSDGDTSQLNALSFVWSIPEWQWQRVLQLLAMYKELHGNLQVPHAFVVPSKTPWPAEAWGLKLGFSVINIRHNEHYIKDEPERRAELDAMGFVWDDLERRWELTRDALAMYKELLGDLQVPIAFVVPSEAPWPAEAWGLKLGNRVNNIRAHEHHIKNAPERRAELQVMGFRWYK